MIVEAVERLNQMRLFDAMSSQDRTRWAERFRREHCHRGAEIIRQGARPTAFYIVDQGELRASARADGEDLPRAYYYPGDFFGETSLLTGQLHNTTVDVLTDAELLVLDKLDFDQLLEEFPVIRERLRALGRQREEAGGMRFPWQQTDEVTLFFSTKHWIALFRKLRPIFLLGILGLFSAAFALGTAFAGFGAAILILVAGTTLALTVFFGVYHFLDWRNDHYIITSLRVLHVERVLLLREYRDEAPFGRVQDVQVNQQGVLANVLNFGDVVIQTAAATERIVFADVPQPHYVRDALFGPLHHGRDRERAEVREAIREELGHRLSIPVTSSKKEAESGKSKGSGLSETGAPKGTEEARDLLDWLRRARKKVRNWFTFETWILSDGGKTITWRKNGWLLIKVSLVPVLIAIGILTLFVWTLGQGVGSPWIPLSLLLLLLSVFGYWFYVYWDWQNDIYQISGNRLVDLKKRPLFLEEFRRETTLDRVENVGLSIPGPIAQLLNYGTVVIETAGETGAFRFESVHNPRGVQEEIFNRRERFNRQRHQVEMHRRRAEMAEWFEIYDELKQRQE